MLGFFTWVIWFLLIFAGVMFIMNSLNMKKLFLSLLAFVLTVCAEAQVIQIMDGDKLVEQISVKAATRVVFAQQPAYEAVDLGLSVKWASFNVGAVNAWETGDCFAWGETETKGSFGGWDSYFDTPDGGSTFSIFHSGEGGLTVLDAEHDVAHVKWGGNWRMPTIKEIRELYINCDSKASSLRGVEGWLFTSKVNGNSIFLPFTTVTETNDGSIGSASYWSSSLGTNGDPTDQKAFFFSISSNSLIENGSSRCNGYSVRPVCRE